MIERFRLWLFRWLGVSDAIGLLDLTVVSDKVWFGQSVTQLEEAIKIQQTEIRELRAEVTRLMLERYVPPQQPEPERKVIKTQTFKQFSNILEQEQEQEEMRNAV